MYQYLLFFKNNLIKPSIKFSLNLYFLSNIFSIKVLTSLYPYFFSTLLNSLNVNILKFNLVFTKLYLFLSIYLLLILLNFIYLI